MSDSRTNRILDQLPPDLCSRILVGAEDVSLPIRYDIYTPEAPPRHIHFMTGGIASIVTMMSSGDGVETGIVGREGVPEALHLLGSVLPVTQCFIQVPGSALRVDFRRFQQEFFPLPPVQRLIFQQVQISTMTTSQLGACNRLHEVEERLARWLLMVSDRIGSHKFHLTQEFLSEMIGSRRSTVTLAAATLKRSGLIDYNRGDIRILDRSALEDSACECYPIVRKLFDTMNA